VTPTRSELEAELALQLRAKRIPFEREVTLIPGRRFRVDFLLPGRVAVEVEGGSWNQGRHTRGAGFASLCEKHNEHELQGVLLLHVTGEQVRDGQALAWIERALANRGAA
jgi:hypothetical protein